jgi:hypothetical protein
MRRKIIIGAVLVVVLVVIFGVVPMLTPRHVISPNAIKVVEVWEFGILPTRPGAKVRTCPVVFSNTTSKTLLVQSIGLRVEPGPWALSLGPFAIAPFSSTTVFPMFRLILLPLLARAGSVSECAKN